MSKVRDLGINYIPLTMQPPGIGAGGGTNPEDSTCGTCTNCTADTCTGTIDDDCKPHSGGHEPPGCRGTRHCGEHSHKDKKDKKDKHKAGGLTHEVVAQLKAQLQNHVGNELAG